MYTFSINHRLTEFLLCALCIYEIVAHISLVLSLLLRYCFTLIAKTDISGLFLAIIKLFSMDENLPKLLFNCAASHSQFAHINVISRREPNERGKKSVHKKLFAIHIMFAMHEIVTNERTKTWKIERQRFVIGSKPPPLNKRCKW